MVRTKRKRIVELVAGVVVVIALTVYAAFALVNDDAKLNSYRDGTTHTVTLSNSGKVINGLPECSNDWYVERGYYSWQAHGVPRSWGAAPVTGKLHIIDSQDPAHQTDPGPAATFTARGITLDLSGGKRGEWGVALDCAGYPGGYAAGTG